MQKLLWEKACSCGKYQYSPSYFTLLWCMQRYLGLVPALFSNPETVGFLWGFCGVFCPFFKAEQSARGTNQEDICPGYIIIFLRQSRFSGYSCADCAQNQPAKGSSGAKIYLYSAGQTLYNQAVTAERRRLFLICAKAPMGQCLSQRQRPYLPLRLPRLRHFEYMTAT